MIKFVFRWAFRLLVLAIVLTVAALLLKDTLARSFAEHRIRRDTGFDAKIGRLEFSLFAPVVRLEDVVLYNPAEFGGGPMLEMPDVHFEYYRGELVKGKTRLKLLRLNIHELQLVESQDGRTNLVDFVGRVAPEAIGPRASRRVEESAFVGVDTLNLSVGKVRYTSLRVPRRNQEIQVGMENEIIRNVKNEQDLAAILFKVLLRAGITVYFDNHGSPISATKL